MNQPRRQFVVHHSADYDGIFCREIAKKFLPDAMIVGWDYGDPTPLKAELNGDEELYMLDISIPDLMSHPRLVWIDHHKSAIEKFPTNIVGYRIDGVAACRLAWQWFTNRPADPQPGDEMPMKEDFVERKVSEPWSVRLAGEYDIWDKRDPDAELFQHGLRSRDISNDWPLLLRLDEKSSIKEIEALVDIGHQDLLNPDGTVRNPVVLGLLKNGRAIQYSKERENESVIKAAGFDLEFEGLKFLACNAARYNSRLFTAGVREDHDALFGFNFDGKQWRVSLYHAPGKEHHDLSVIAVKYGGGGHRGACGFRLEKLPFSA